MRHLSRGARCAILLRFDSNGTGICAGGGVTKAMKEARNTEGVWPYLALLAGMVCIAWSAIFVRWTDMPGPASAFYRLLIPAIVLLPTWFFKPDKERLDSKSLAIIAVGGLFFALDLAFYNTSILRTSAANATILGNNTPIFVGLLTWLVFRRPPRLMYWLGLALAIGGSIVIVRSDLLRHVKLGSGDAMALTASACFAVYLIATERVRTSASTLGFLRLAILSSTVFLLVINLAMRVSLAIPRGHSWAALLGLGLVSQLGGYLALTYAMGHLPATVTSVSLLAQVPLTALLAALLLGELLTGSQILGGMLVLAGVGLASRRSRPAEEANATLCEAGEHE
jgi:drug/metabolite transporter (DMT)-like permease